MEIIMKTNNPCKIWLFALYNNAFYLLEFKNFSPDYKEIKSNQTIKFELTYVHSISALSFCTLLLKDYLFDFTNDNIVKSNGKIEITVKKFHLTVLYMEIYLNLVKNNKSYFIST